MTRHRSVFRSALAGSVLAMLGLALPIHSRAQTDMPLFDGQLENGWQNWSWATVNLASTAYVHTGGSSIQVSITASNQALYLEHAATNTALYTALTFWINGGASSGQNLRVLALINGQGQTAVLLNTYVTGGAVATGVWRQVTIPLSALGAANTTELTGLQIQDNSGGSQPSFYVADISLVAAPAPAVVNVTVSAAQPGRTVDDRLFGVNLTMWDGQIANAQTIALVQAAGLRTVRLPGGSVSDEYHWKTNTSLSNTWTWASGFPSFAQLISGINAQVFVTVNYGSGTQQEAAAWVAYANASATLQGTGGDVSLGVDSKGTDWKTAGYWSALRAAAPLATDDGLNFLRLGHPTPFALKCWEVGNECYGSWETDQHAAQWDPATYANVAKTYIPLMKAVDPSIKVGVVAEVGEDNLDSKSPIHYVPNPVTSATHHGWTPVMLTTLKSTPTVLPDFLIYHRYEQGPGGESDAILLQSARTWPGDAADLRMQLTDYLGASGAGIELCVTENNSVYSNPGKQSTSLVNGLFYADSFGNLLQTEFNSFLWWAMRNGPPTDANGHLTGNQSSSLYGWRQYGDYGILSSPSSVSGETTAFDPYPPYYAMKLLSHFARGGDRVVPASSDSLLVSAFSTVRGDGSLSLLVINKSPSNTLPTNLTLAGFVPQSTAAVYSYGIPQDSAAQTGTGSADIAISSQSVAGAAFSLSLPPYSATVLRLAAAGVASITAPSSQVIAAGQAAVFTVVADGSPAPTFQWQGSVDGGATWTNLANDASDSGVTTSALTVSPAGIGFNGYRYRCLATNSAGTATSAAAELTVLSEPALVDLLFQDVLDRPADPGGLANFEAALAVGTPPATLLGNLLGSAEYAQRQVEAATRLYYAALARPPDFTGLQNWSNALQNGVLTLTGAADEFAASPEFRLKYGSLDNTGYVQQLYRNVLGREADPAGLASWVAQLDSGASRGTILVGFSESDEFKGNMAIPVEILRLYFLLLQRMPTTAELQGWTGFFSGDGQTDAVFAQAFPYGLADTSFVQAAFRGFLCRDADAGALTAFAAALGSGATTRGGLVDTLVNSAEFSQFTGPVSRLYLAAFHRGPDQQGLINWVNSLKGGNPLQSVADSFAASQEFSLTYGSLSDSDYVNLLYQNVLGRAADPAGLADWTGRLASGNTRGQVLVGFSESPEAIHRFAPTVRTYLSYFAFLGAAPTQPDLGYWTNYFATLTDQLRQTLLDEAAGGS